MELKLATLAEPCVRTDMIWHILSVNKELTIEYLSQLDPYGLEPENLLPDCHPKDRELFRKRLRDELKD